MALNNVGIARVRIGRWTDGDDQECNPFTFVEINGLRVPEPSAAYPLLWEAVTGHDASAQGHLKISPKEALSRLGIHFGVGASENTGPAW